MWNPKREIYIIEAFFVKFDTWAYIEGYNIDTIKWYIRAYKLYFYIEDAIISAPIFTYYASLKGHIKFFRWKYTSGIESIISNLILIIFYNYVKPVVAQVYDYYILSKAILKIFSLYINKSIIEFENRFIIKFANVDAEVNGGDFIIKQNRCLTYSEVINMLNRRQKSKFYAPLLSFWPLFLTSSLALFLIFMSIFLHSSTLYNYLNFLTIISLIAVGIAVSFWFSIFFIEKKKGNHVVEIRRNIQLGFYLFLFTEILCFVSLFWVFFHSFLAASLHIGIYNPGEGIANLYINEFVKINRNWNVHYFKSIGTPSYFRISTIYTMMDRELYASKDIKIHVNFYDRGQLVDPYKLPLLNTVILLTSAASLNLSHVSVRTSKYLSSFFWLLITILLGLLFVSVQFNEYKNCSFQYNDGIFAACFFSLTGLHGIHVIIGISALIICGINLLFHNYSPNSHQSYAYSILYWHFVDIVWIIVYFTIYLWPASYFFCDDIYTTYKSFFTVNFSKNYFNKAVALNYFYEYKYNSKLIYNYYCRNFCLKYINRDIMESGLDDSFDKENFFKSKWIYIKNEYSDGYFTKIKNLDEITDVYGKCIGEMAATPVIISDIKAANYANCLSNNEINYPTDVDFKNYKSYKLNNVPSALTISDVFDYNELCYNWKSVYSLNQLDEQNKDFNLIIKNYFLYSHELNVYRNSFISACYNIETELLYEEFLRECDSINYNEVKRDPLMFCFVLTEMNKELVNLVECAYLYDLHDKYKRFMIYKFLDALNLKFFAYWWAYFFFPYIITNDASVRYRI